MNETLFSDLVKEWGDFVLEQMTSTLYSSDLVNIFLYFIFVAAFIRLGRALVKKEDLLRSSQIFICWFLILPVERKPVFYHLLNTASTAFSYSIQKSMYDVLKVGNTNNVLPPGFVFSSILRAGIADIKDPQHRADIRYLIDNCLPPVENKQGRPFSALDLFGGTVSTDSTGTEAFTLNFESSLLKNRKLTLPDGSPSNCYDLLINTRSSVRRELRRQNLTTMSKKIYYGSNAGETLTNKTTWTPEGSEYDKMKRISLNLAEAHAYQKSVLKDYFRFPENSSDWAKMSNEVGTMSPLTILSKNAFSQRGNFMGYNFDPTRYVTELANAPSALAKTMGLEGAVDAGFIIHEMNDDLIDLPMKISAIQLWLKLAAPIVILLILIPKAWSVVSAWSLGWFLSMLAPVVFMFTRSLANQIIYWAVRLDRIVEMTSGHPAFLNLGVSFDAANRLMLDASKWMSIFLEVEKYIGTSLIMIIPLIGGLYTHTKVAGLLKNTMNAGGQEFTRKGVRSVAGAATHTMRRGASVAAPYVIGGPVSGTANLAKKAFRSLYNKTRGPSA